MGMSPQVVVYKLYLEGVPLFRQLYFTSDVFRKDYSGSDENIVSGDWLVIKTTKTIAGYICTKRRFSE